MGAAELIKTIRAGEEKSPYEHLESWAKDMYRGAKKNAETRGIPFEIGKDEFAIFIGQCDMACSVCGIEFDFRSTRAKNLRRPFYPSLDRIDSSGPYKIGNVRLVCIAINLAMNTWGKDVFMKIAEGAVAKNLGGARITRWSKTHQQIVRKLPVGVAFRKGKRDGRQYAALLSTGHGWRYVIRWVGSEEEAAEIASKARELFAAGKTVDVIGYEAVYQHGREGHQAHRFTPEERRFLYTNLPEVSEFSEIATKSIGSARFDGLPDRDRT